jgi:hypothetical protein
MTNTHNTIIQALLKLWFEKQNNMLLAQHINSRPSKQAALAETSCHPATDT